MTKTRQSNAKPLEPVKPPAPPEQQAPPGDPFEGKLYRVRLMKLSLIVDVYDADGNYIDREETNPPVLIPEVRFPPGIERLLVENTNLKRGFNAMSPAKRKMEEAG
jgi:hypothetical protein